jgi:hypothetical protein
MAENPGDPAGDDHQRAQSDAAKSDGAKSDGAKPGEGNAMDSNSSNLPMVVAPKLDAGADDHVDATLEMNAAAGEAAGESSAAAAGPAPSSRFVMLAASVAFAAAFGSFVGAISGSGMARFVEPAAPAATPDSVNEALRTMKQELAELTALKTSLDSATRSTTSQFAKITDRLDHIDQRAALPPDTTGSIAGSSPAAEPAKLTDRILQDWIVQDVQNGRALVESRYGGIFDVGAGSVLPGVGRVETVKRQDGQWIVVTAHGLITSGR